MINKVILLGRLGKNAEVTVINETKMTKFSVATSNSYKDKSGKWQESTEWHNITAWAKLAEQAEDWNKGDLVYVEGSISTTKTDDGKYFTNIKAFKLRKVSGDSPVTGQAKEPQEAPTEEGDDDLPF